MNSDSTYLGEAVGRAAQGRHATREANGAELTLTVTSPGAFHVAAPLSRLFFVLRFLAQNHVCSAWPDTTLLVCSACCPTPTTF